MCPPGSSSDLRLWLGLGPTKPPSLGRAVAVIGGELPSASEAAMKPRGLQAVLLLLVLSVVLAAATVAVAATVLIEPAPAERLLVVDTDAGADDAVAILALLRAEAEAAGFRGADGSVSVPRLVAITSVHGNTGVVNVTRNVFATLDCAERLDVPVYAGAVEPLLPPGSPIARFFGDDGFGDFQPPGPPLGEVGAEHAAVALVRLARERPGELVLICIGPLTNVALATRLDPGFLDNLQAIFILGGAAHGIGNVAPGVEFNVQQDPEAALIVLDAIPSGKPAFLLPWETALDAEVPLAWRRDVLGSSGTRSTAFLNLAERVSLAEAAASGSPWTCADGLLAAAFLDARVAAPARAVRVSVVAGVGAGRGVSLVDHANTTGLAANAVLLERPDAAAFQRLLLRLLAS